MSSQDQEHQRKKQPNGGGASVDQEALESMREQLDEGQEETDDFAHLLREPKETQRDTNTGPCGCW